MAVCVSATTPRLRNICRPFLYGCRVAVVCKGYLVPGLWGAPLKAVGAFAPPLYTQDFNLYGGTFEEFDDYDKGMAYAKQHGKPVLLDFSGYACVNCRKMEGAVFDTPTVRGIISKDYVMIKLMVDDKADLAEPMTVVERRKNYQADHSRRKMGFTCRGISLALIRSHTTYCLTTKASRYRNPAFTMKMYPNS